MSIRNSKTDAVNGNAYNSTCDILHRTVSCQEDDRYVQFSDNRSYPHSFSSSISRELAPALFPQQDLSSPASESLLNPPPLHSHSSVSNMPKSKEYSEAPMSSSSSLPLLSEKDENGHDYRRPASKSRRILRQLLWPTVIHGLILLTYTSIIFFGAKRWLAERDCHKPLVYCTFLKNRAS